MEWSLQSLWILIALFGNICVNGLLECQNSPLDIVVVIDTSDNVAPARLATEKEFMKEIVNNIMAQDNRFGLVTFGSQALIQFHLNAYQSIDDIRMAVDYLWSSTGQGSVENAIKYTIENGFGATGGNRQDVPDVIVVISLTSDINSLQLLNISDLLQQNMIEMVLLGTGDVNSDPIPNVHILPAPSSTSLTNDADGVMNIICQAHGVLKPWTTWSACSATCDRGTRRRFRECQKRLPSDECDDNTIEEMRCLVRNCTDPIDGGWTYWNDWSSCTETCGTGIQTRTRDCSAPVPTNGGIPCQGLNIQRKNCSEWKCPDCTAACETGSHLSKECDRCECPSTILSGVVVGRANIPQSGAEVFLKSLPYRALTTTDDSGTFKVVDLCLKNTEVLLRKEGYIDLVVVPVQLDSLHWIINATMKSIVKPIIVKQPMNAVRLVGQNWTICCKAEGRPKPDAVQWYKDGIELNVTADTITLQTVHRQDEGQYSCVVETIAGVAKSNIASLRVVDNPDDACSRPLFQAHQLPTDCFAVLTGQKTSVVDIGKCQRQRCISSDFRDNQTCGTLESTNCCDEGASEKIEVQCVGFSYSMKRITSCQCQRCITNSIISGQAFGKMDNGTKVPFAYGYLLVNGKQAAVTNELGFFRFEMPSDQDKAIVYFVDEVFKRFVPSTKVISLQSDSTTSVTIVLPLQPAPVHFDSANGISLNLGGSTEFPPAGGLTIPEDSIVTEDGTPFTGQAKAFVHFMDPRKLNDIEASNGDFVYKTEDGSVAPLETFGMFHTSIEDSSGNKLKVKKKMSFTLDASLFNVSNREDGSPDLSLWDFDVNNGVWIETARMRLSDSTPKTGRRKLLDSVLIGEFEQQEIPHIDLTEEVPVYERVIIGYTNCDHSVPIYADRIVTRSVKVQHNACYVSVSIYEDLSFNKTAGAGTNVVAVTKDMYGPKYKGMDSKTTDENGHVCLSVFCGSKVFIYAESKVDNSRLIANSRHNVPIWYGNSKNTKNDTEIEINSYNLEGVFENGKTRYGPFVTYEDFAVCKSGSQSNYEFQLAYYSMTPTLTTTMNKNDYDSNQSWYPVSPDKPFAKACFVKVAIQTTDPSVRFIANSYYGESKKDALYGTYDVSPIFDLDTSNRTYRGACIEFRCPGRNNDNGNISFNTDTVVDVFLTTKQKCHISNSIPSLNVTQLASSSGFRLTVDPRVDYGPNFGVYIANGRADTVSSFCTSGSDTGAVGASMKPHINPAVTYSCD